MPVTFLGGASKGSSGGLRILAVDDSVLVRHVVRTALEGHASVSDIAVAASGRIALQRCPLFKPDVVLLDLKMRNMDGLATLGRLLEADSGLRVVLFVAESEWGEQAVKEGLRRGASAFVPKPSGMKNTQESIVYIQDVLLPQLERVVRGRAAAPTGSRNRATTPGRANRSAKLVPGRSGRGLDLAQLKGIPLDSGGRLDVLAIGVSTGGPNALAKIFETLPSDLAVPVLVVQHMPAEFTKQLALRLDLISGLRVREARDGELLQPGHALVAPGDYHMLVRASGNGPCIQLNQGPLEHACRPAVDPMMRSVVKVYGSRALGLILTGMGSDGSRGCFEIRKAGGVVMAQDKQSSVVWGMPGVAAESGYCARVLALDEIGFVVGTRLRKGR